MSRELITIPISRRSKMRFSTVEGSQRWYNTIWKIETILESFIAQVSMKSVSFSTDIFVNKKLFRFYYTLIIKYFRLFFLKLGDHLCVYIIFSLIKLYSSKRVWYDRNI